MNRRTVKKLKEDESSSANSTNINYSLVSSGNESSEEEDEVTKRNNVAMEKVFQIPSVVEQIIQEAKNLSDLKQCRLVNSMWKETTTKVMLKRNSAFVVLNRYSAVDVLGLDSGELKCQFMQFFTDHYDSWYTLEDEQDFEDADDLSTLKEIVDKSTQFPSSTFVMFKGVLSNPGIEDFLEVVGKSIKNLKLIRVEGMSVKYFAQNFGLHCPNLETLYMDEGYIEWSPETSFELPKLKVLDMKYINLSGTDRESPFKILASLIAPNLQVIRGFDLSRDWEAVAEAGKTHCVKKLKLEVGKPVDLPKLEMLVQADPQLETLKLRLCDSFNLLDYEEKMKWMRLIQKLLDLSKTTLKSFNFRGIEHVFGNLHFQQFSQLREIEIDSSCEDEQAAGLRYPYEILKDGISPNLKVIKGFDLYCDTQQVLRAGKIHCVKQLDFEYEGPELESSLRLFLSVRPQLESLGFYGLHRLETMDLDRTRELTGLLEQLLDLSKDTLKGFRFEGVGAVLEDMKCPKFSKLEHLVIEANCVRIFPRGINLTETFPTLEILDLGECFSFDRDENWDKYFPPPDAVTGSLTSVKTLIVSKKFTQAAKRDLRTICPNAKILC